MDQEKREREERERLFSISGKIMKKKRKKIMKKPFVSQNRVGLERESERRERNVGWVFDLEFRDYGHSF